MCALKMLKFASPHGTRVFGAPFMASVALHRSASITTVIFAAFAVVSIPLAVVVGTALYSVDNLAKQNRELLAASAVVVDGLALREHATELERAARQFQVLRESEVYSTYLSKRQKFYEAARHLDTLDLSGDQQELLDRLLKQEMETYEFLSAGQFGTDAEEIVNRKMIEMAALVGTIITHAELRTADEIVVTREAVSSTFQRLLAQVAIVIPATLLFAWFITKRITQPIEAVNEGIRNLGAGHFDDEIRIKGTRDMERVGESLNEMRQRLMQIEKDRVTFLQHMSHELKTPLASLREGTALLAEEVAGHLHPDQVSVVAILQTNVQELQQRIENLLDFSISQASTPLAVEKPIQLHALIESLVSSRALTARRRYLKVETDLEQATLVGNHDKLASVLDNLLSNAIKYSPRGGRIHLQLRRQNGCAVMDFRDEGIGIDAAERDKVFEPFYQGRTIGGHVKGTGLGLAIVAQYVKEHNGKVAIEDTAQGTHIRLTLPLAGSAIQA